MPLKSNETMAEIVSAGLGVIDIMAKLLRFDEQSVVSIRLV